MYRSDQVCFDVDVSKKSYIEIKNLSCKCVSAQTGSSTKGKVTPVVKERFKSIKCTSHSIVIRLTNHHLNSSG